MFRRRKACASEYKASLLAVVNERSQGSLKAVQSYGIALPSLFKAGKLYSFAFHPPNICKILPRRRGSGSDEVADEGVETRAQITDNREQITEYRVKSRAVIYDK